MEPISVSTAPEHKNFVTLLSGNPPIVTHGICKQYTSDGRLDRREGMVEILEPELVVLNLDRLKPPGAGG